jgi:hypothetical protein
MSQKKKRNRKKKKKNTHRQIIAVSVTTGYKRIPKKHHNRSCSIESAKEKKRNSASCRRPQIQLKTKNKKKKI